MLNEATKKLLTKATELWGEKFQQEMIIEECGELIVALRHFDRGKCTIEKVMEEVADVMIVCMQFGNDNGEAALDIVMMNKLERLKKRVDEDNPQLQ